MDIFDRRRLAHITALHLYKETQNAALLVQASCTEAARSQVREFYLDGGCCERVIIYLHSPGCRWAAQTDGGCYMCGHWAGTKQGQTIPSSLIVEQVHSELAKYDWAKYPVLCVYNAGSFTCDREITPQARREILQAIGAVPELKLLIVESRPEFITPPMAEQFASLVPFHVQVGVGLESASDRIRRLCINKGFEREDFELAIATLNQAGVGSLAYVLLKPPFLTEIEAMEDAVDSVRYAFEVGVEAVSLEPVSVQPHTLIERLHDAGVYRVPWTWSVREVIRATAHLGDVRIGGFEYHPAPYTIVHNCPDCDEAAYHAIAHYNATKDLGPLNALDCSCIGAWEAECGLSTEPLEQRIISDCLAVHDASRQSHWGVTVPCVS
ncbi:MAG: archaeosine biosynthesis radical SAM protein RaSEA [Armatimonadia bacterium]